MNLLENINVHPDWEGFLTSQTEKFISEIEKKIIKTGFTPNTDKVLRFLSVPLKQVKVIIIGQDPYPQPGIATGRAFEVGTLKSWSEPFSNISLKNILRAIYKAYSGTVIKYNHLKEKFDNEFPVLAPNKLFQHWEEQGVLLLNTYLTCQPGKPGSHKEIWDTFSKKLFEYINLSNPGSIWFLWGNHAQLAVEGIFLNNRIDQLHPMMCFDKEGRENDFLFGKVNCFEKTKNTINWTGYNIDESLLNSDSLF
ncbi:MAG: uracil-DNA glycosylase [Prolixibacteraceae bacterium]|nr:uracil-DNA glycosylase [Prolixibacteraceae bacterium]MBN2775402.1 uracil-DNA glycosylase [Prolixibacteraceae bacterium]